MVGFIENITNFPDQLQLYAISLLLYSTLLDGGYTIAQLSYFFNLLDSNRNQIVIVYGRVIMVGCSENITNFPDQLR